MTDKELLELAAKAADITLSHWDKTRNTFAPVIGVSGEWWNPLTDDGDAMRLAVNLAIRIYRNNESGYTSCDYVSLGKYSDDFIEFDNANEDEYAATRRAIVRAAAEIGKTL